MAQLVTCRFCKQITVDNDHEGCARKYGEKIEKEIIDHYLLFPECILPSSALTTHLSTDEWKWYGEYKARVKNRSEMEVHIQKMCKTVKEKVELILQKNRVEIDALLIPLDGRNFTVAIGFTVNIQPEVGY